MTYEIFLKNLDGKQYVLTVKINDTVLDVKKKIESQLNISMSEMSLSFCNKTLKDENYLSYYSIAKSSTLIISKRLPGG